MRSRALAGLIGVGITVALLAWVLRDVSFGEVWHAARSADLLWILAAVLLATSTFVLRLFRWRLILRTAEDRPLPTAALWHSIAIGFMANNILPFRAGELVRAFAVTRLGGVPITTALSSLLLERLFDAVTIITLLFVGLLSAGIPASTQVAGFEVAELATRTAMLVGILLGACVVGLAFPKLADGVIHRLAPARLADRVVGMLDGVRSGLGALRSPSRIAAVTLWSAAVWLVNGLSFYAGFKAFQIVVGFGGALLQQSLLVLGIAVPSTPGFFGPFEAAIKAVLALFGVDSNAAVSFALTYHFTTFLPITLLGLWSLARTPVSLKGLREASAAAAP